MVKMSRPFRGGETKKGFLICAKEMIRKYNITYQAVNHYTDFGFLPVSAKKGNVRLYNKKLMDKRLLQIRNLAKEGYSLRVIRKKILGF
ncbi:MAG: MerR family transcriptional regulator [Candidatus Omnitrophota bacterium]|jgi:DNA-binding transcriptional MerR regulator